MRESSGLANKLIHEIEAVKDSDRNLIIAIDGDCCSGKTTLAKKLAEQFSCNIIHIDDFYLPIHLRSENRFKQPGRNIHWERLLDEVLSPLQDGQKVKYCKYIPEKKAFSSEITLEAKPLTIVEGTYALLPELQHFYSIKVNLSVDLITQYKRIEKREPSEKVNQFKRIWIPKSKTYLDMYDIENNSDFNFDTSETII